MIHGGRSETDLLAHAWAEQQGIATEVFAADWRRQGMGAGPASQQRMLEDGHPDMLVAFPGGRGTPDLIESARARGLNILDLR